MDRNCSNCGHWVVQHELEYVRVPTDSISKKLFSNLLGWCKLTMLNETTNTEAIQAEGAGMVLHAVSFDADEFDSALKTSKTFYCNQYQAWEGGTMNIPRLNAEELILNKTPTTYNFEQVFGYPEKDIDQLLSVAAICNWHSFVIHLEGNELSLKDKYFSDPNRARWIVSAGLDILRSETDPLSWKYDVGRFNVSRDCSFPNVEFKNV